MTNKINVLVLGVGGNVSQGILKALALSSLDLRVVGACVDPLSMGLFTVDKAYLSPLGADPNFLEWLLGVCRAEQIDVILSGVEPVLHVLAEHRDEIRRLTGAESIVSRPDQLAISDDKLKTCEWLRDNGLNYPQFAKSEDMASVELLARRCGYPLIAKPRAGKGSQGIVMVRNPTELFQAFDRENYVVQEYLGTVKDEYTAGCFCDSSGKNRGTIIMKRELEHGTTYRAVLGDYPEIREECNRIIHALKPMGPCNLQMRLAGNRAVCFEINLRFSGTTPMRARFGFNDVEAAIRHYILKQEIPDLPLVTRGIALRYWNEVYVDPAAEEELRARGHLDDPRGYDHVFEDYGE